jgi:hypothetical protein
VSARAEWLNHPLTRQLRRDVEEAGARLESALEHACRGGSLEKVRVMRASLDLVGNVHAMIVKKDEAEDGED